MLKEQVSPSGIRMGFDVQANQNGAGSDFLKSVEFAGVHKVTPSDVLKFIQGSTQFKDLKPWMRLGEDAVGMVRRIPHKVEGHLPDKAEAFVKQTLFDKLSKEMQKTGKVEGAEYGVVRINNRTAVLFALNWDFFAGSFGVVAGEKFQEAVDLAVENNIPFIGIYSSSGARQQEAMPALEQLPRMNHALYKLWKETPVGVSAMGIEVGQDWGGMSASVARFKYGVRVALKDGMSGFSGPKLIEAYTRDGNFDRNAQTVRKQGDQRQVDVILPSEEDFLKFTGRYLEVTNPRHRKLTYRNLPAFKPLIKDGPKDRMLRFRGVDLTQELVYGSPDVNISPLFQDAPEDERLYRQYEILRRDAQRPDARELIGRIFTNVVNLYPEGYLEQEETAETKRTVFKYPAIIAAIGKIGPQPYLIIADQPSYQLMQLTGQNPHNRFRQKEKYQIIKVPASPKPEDFRYMVRMLDLGKKLGLPLVTFTDTMGANPTIESEKNGISEAISEAIAEINEYPELTMSFVIGAEGSGGGKGTNPEGDFRAVGSNCQGYVADPFFSAVINYSDANPSKEQVKGVICSSKPTAVDQFKMGLLDAIIEESDNPGISTDVNVFAANIRRAIAETTIGLQDMPQDKRLKRRDQRIRNLRGVKIVEDYSGKVYSPTDADIVKASKQAED